MPEKDPMTYQPLTYLAVIGLAAFGGVVSWMRKLRAGHARAFNVAEMVGEVCTSAFAGLLAFWACEATGIEPLWTAVIVGITGHMGTRALFLAEQWLERRYLPPQAP